MPKVHAYKDGRGFYIKANQGGKITTYQVTADGVAELRQHGREQGAALSPAELRDMAVRGLIFTGGGGPRVVEPVLSTPDPVDRPLEVIRPATAARAPRSDEREQKFSRRERKRLRREAQLVPLPIQRGLADPSPTPFPWDVKDLLLDDTPGASLEPSFGTHIKASNSPPASVEAIPQPPPVVRRVEKPPKAAVKASNAAPVRPRVRKRRPVPGVVKLLLALFVFLLWMLVFGVLFVVFTPTDTPVVIKVLGGLFVLGMSCIAAVAVFRSRY